MYQQAMSDGLLVGRFQPFHLGHLAALQYALSIVDRLWVGIGSPNKPPSPENPFTAAERKEMILASVAGKNNDDDMYDNGISGRISIYEIPDVDDHKKWLVLIDKLLPAFDTVFTNDDLTAHLYSRRENIRVMAIPFLNRDMLSGTRIRDMIRQQQQQQQQHAQWQDAVPRGTREVLERCGAASRLARLSG